MELHAAGSADEVGARGLVPRNGRLRCSPPRAAMMHRVVRAVLRPLLLGAHDRVPLEELRELELETNQMVRAAYVSMLPLQRRIDETRPFVKPELLADFAALDARLPPARRGVATTAGILASMADLDRVLKAEFAPDHSSSSGPDEQRFLSDVQQVVALVPGHTTVDPTHRVADWHDDIAALLKDAQDEAARRRQTAIRAEAQRPLPAREMYHAVMVMRDACVVANQVEGLPLPAAATRGPERWHRDLAQKIRISLARHHGAARERILGDDTSSRN